MFDAVSSTFSQITSTNRPVISRNYSCDDAASLRIDDSDAFVPPAPKDEFEFEVPDDPFISPYNASDETLKKFPPVRILVRN